LHLFPPWAPRISFVLMVHIGFFTVVFSVLGGLWNTTPVGTLICLCPPHQLYFRHVFPPGSPFPPLSLQSLFSPYSARFCFPFIHFYLPFDSIRTFGLPLATTYPPLLTCFSDLLYYDSLYCAGCLCGSSDVPVFFFFVTAFGVPSLTPQFLGLFCAVVFT